MKFRAIGITGPSGSGKTTVAHALVDKLGDASACSLSLDSYYHDLSHLPFEERKTVNFDAPDAFESELLIEQIDILLSGKPVQIPEYSFHEHVRTVRVHELIPRRWTILEGLHAGHWPALRTRMELIVYLDVDDAECLARRLKRDVEERGRSAESVHAQYEACVRPMAEKYVHPVRTHADLVLDGTLPVERIVSDIAYRLAAITAQD
jgi:uridine kinase